MSYFTIGLIIPIMQIVIGVMAARVNRFAGILMIVGPVLRLVSQLLIYQYLPRVPGRPSRWMMDAVSLFPIFAGVIFFIGVVMIILQAGALKKRAMELEMLLAELQMK